MHGDPRRHPSVVFQNLQGDFKAEVPPLDIYLNSKAMLSILSYMALRLGTFNGTKEGTMIGCDGTMYWYAGAMSWCACGAMVRCHGAHVVRW